MSEITYRGAKFSYELINQNAKIKIIYFSDFMIYSPKLDFSRQIKNLEDYATIIIPSRHGYGHSDMVIEKRDFLNILGETSYLLHTLHITENVIAIGHGYGAALAMEFAKKNEKMVKLVILLNPELSFKQAFKKKISIFLLGLASVIKKQNNRDKIKQKLLLNNVDCYNALEDACDIYLEKQNNFCLVKELSGINKQYRKTYLTDDGLHQDIKLTIVCGENHKDDALEIAKKYPKAKVENLASQGKYIHYDLPNEVSNIIINSIKEI